MSAVPRVRVAMIGHGPWTEKCGTAGLWKWACQIPNHPGDEEDWSDWGYSDPGEAAQAAADHARTCPALRLARLVAELETLRDKLMEFSFADMTIGGLHSNEAVANWAIGQSVARRAVADDLDRLIKETNR